MRAQIILALIIGSTLCFVEAVGQSRQAASNQDAISLGATRLSAGMPQDAIIAKLAEEYNPQKEGADTWLVLQKDGPANHPVASVDFKNGKLQAVRKYWGPEDQVRGVEFAETIYGLIASFSEEGRRDCTISTGETHAPGFDGRAAFILCGQKRIEIDIDRGTKLAQPVATIDEVLESR